MMNNADVTDLIQLLRNEGKIPLENLTIEQSQVFLQMQLYGDVAQVTEEDETAYWIIPEGSSLAE